MGAATIHETASTKEFIQYCHQISNYRDSLRLTDAEQEANQFFLNVSNNQGVIFSYQGFYYEGQIKQKKPEGQGLMRWINEDEEDKNYPFYRGQFKNGKAHGKGDYISTELQFLNGCWKQGSPCSGNLITKSLRSPRKQYFIEELNLDNENGFRNGWAKITLDDKSVYQGNIQKKGNEYLFHGKGYLIFSNGDEYDGDWFEGQFSGTGNYKWKESRKQYVGGYQAGIKEGKGKMKVCKNTWVEGTWVKGNMDGEVTFYDENPGAVTRSNERKYFYKDGVEEKL